MWYDKYVAKENIDIREGELYLIVILNYITDAPVAVPSDNNHNHFEDCIDNE